MTEQRPTSRPTPNRTAGRIMVGDVRPPHKRRGGPGAFVVLGAIALVPALGLLALFNWSDARVPDPDAVPPPSTTIVAPPLPPDPLTDAMLSLRRMPETVSLDLNLAAFDEAVAPFIGSLNDRSCVAVSVDGIDVGAQNATLSVIPASNTKIVVAAAALELLGDDHRFTTAVTAPGGPVDGVIQGDLVIVGGGDPLLSSDWYPVSNLERRPVTSPTSFDTLADRVVAAGVTEITGAVLGDGSRYDDEYFAPGWGNGVAGLEAGPYDALMANDARVLGEDRRADEPVAAAAREFTRLLAERGVTIAGEPGIAPTSAAPGDRTEIASIESAPLSDVIGEMLLNSDNNTSELLVKEIGVERAGTGTRQAGLDAITDVLVEWGIDTNGVVLADGSGLSLDNRLTCGALLDILQRYEASEPIGAGLPIAAQSGTLADVFTDHPIAGRLLGKTGTLNNPPFNEDPPAVKALAGYVTVDGGTAVEYVLILNGPTISDQSEYRPVWNRLVDILVTYPAGPTPAELSVRP